MVKVALCDDESEQQEAVICLLREYAKARPEQIIKLSIFSSGRELLAADGAEDYDIYVLDVVMPGMSGIDLGMRLREQGCEGAIVYLSFSPEFAVKSYEAQAFYYLMKPVVPQRLYQVLDQAVALMEKRRETCVAIRTKTGVQLVQLDKIVYAELVGRTVRYHFTNGEQVDSVTLRGSFREEMAPLLTARGFFSCGASFVVNLYYVTAVEKHFLKLDGGEQVPLTRGLATRARQQWSDYWLNVMR